MKILRKWWKKMNSMISILLKDVRITVRIKNTSEDPFTTNVGFPQGDCLSPVLFTYYLAKAIIG